MNDYLATLLIDHQYTTKQEASQLAQWAAEQNIDLTNVLIQLGVFRSTAVRTLELIQKGFVTPPNPGILFTPEGPELLRSLTQASSDVTSELGTDSSMIISSKQRAEKNRTGGRTTTSFSPSATQPAAPTVVPVSASQLVRTDQVEVHPTPPPVSVASPSSNKKPATTPEVGTTLGKCMLTGILGKGGRGTVFSALHRTLNLPVAIKILRTDDQRNSEDRYFELQHEARLLAQLNHQNVTRVLDFDYEPFPYVVMELVEGPNLADLIAQTGGLRVERAAEIILQAALGLAAAWNLKIVHRDIKPANLLLSRDGGGVKVADLGLAIYSSQHNENTTSGMPLGTCAYMAPEQAISAATVDFRADIYSLGATFYHAITGQMPFTAKNAREMLMKHATQPLVPAHEIAPGLVDPAVSLLIERMMAKQPEDRFPNYESLIEELKELAYRTPLSPRPDTQAPQAPTTARSSSILSWFLRKTGTTEVDRAS